MQSAWSDPRVPSSEICVLRPLLERRAQEAPDKIFAKFADGRGWSYRELREITIQTAAALQTLAPPCSRSDISGWGVRVLYPLAGGSRAARRIRCALCVASAISFLSIDGGDGRASRSA
jgi:hypothetical protein